MTTRLFFKAVYKPSENVFEVTCDHVIKKISRKELEDFTNSLSATPFTFGSLSIQLPNTSVAQLREYLELVLSGGHGR